MEGEKKGRGQEGGKLRGSTRCAKTKAELSAPTYMYMHVDTHTCACAYTH